MKIIANQTFDEERALYGAENLIVKNCAFDGLADGESAFKESRNVQVNHCFFNLRYPFWHDSGLKIENSEMAELCRAALWLYRIFSQSSAAAELSWRLRQSHDGKKKPFPESGRLFGRCGRPAERCGSVSETGTFRSFEHLRSGDHPGGVQAADPPEEKSQTGAGI